MDEYIRADNDFQHRREEAYRYSEMARGFGGRFHPRHDRSIHNASSSNDTGNQTQRQQHSSKSSGAQQSSFRPPAPRGRGGRNFGGRYGDQPRKLLFVLRRRQWAYHKNVLGYDPKAERDCRSRSTAESAEAGSTYRFVLLPVCPRVCRKYTAYDLCCFGKSFSSFLGPVATATIASTYSGPQSAARRASPRSTIAQFPGGVRSSHSQQHCARVEAHLLKDILT
jgi:hypothetical protein